MLCKTATNRYRQHWKDSTKCKLKFIKTTELYAYVECEICGTKRVFQNWTDGHMKNGVDWDLEDDGLESIEDQNSEFWENIGGF